MRRNSFIFQSSPLRYTTDVEFRTKEAKWLFPTHFYSNPRVSSLPQSAQGVLGKDALPR